MAEKLTLEIITPEGFSFTETVDELTAPGTLGEFGVLPGHTGFMTSLETGVITYKIGSTSKHITVKSAYAQVANDHILVLADSAEIKG
ncbi:ATP synthase F1 subunit epsilon [Candidatus Magnetominusculus xianensis]|uniref:ATP synthase F0F1 subunit epsilon n=1 Tax=Candidatus Magnetominusculus xianensis TaxID=1748249 RepID=A0ABR5SBP5_9BACT|nr:ATP synthase F1 subunit epsilon [Candidatus Magnetominusculus xianensis]KWT78212.1 ATP synthase F0F1 subunit epsilon [Candidatus Magnetominusculus xianensis]MBF0402836.1 ATP synthase F1 subunit epsilon [Nitrospirota bacterium]